MQKVRITIVLYLGIHDTGPYAFNRKQTHSGLKAYRVIIIGKIPAVSNLSSLPDHRSSFPRCRVKSATQLFCYFADRKFVCN